MIKVTKVEFFLDNNEPPDPCLTKRCPSGRIYVEWETFDDDTVCASIRMDSPESDGYFLTGRYFKRLKVYFENGYVWDTELKPEDAWRRKIYDELKKYVDSDGEDLPGGYQSELSRAARLLDDDMQYEI